MLVCLRLLLKKFSSSSDCWKNLIQKKSSELSVEEVIDKYQGFEGEIVRFYHVADIDSAIEKIKKENVLRTKNNFKLLHVLSVLETTPSNLKDEAVFVGYEVGICEEGETIFSSIFNEILFGNIAELVAYRSMLNDNLLFPDRLLAEKYIHDHQNLSSQGKDVEDYFEFSIYEIWKQHISQINEIFHKRNGKWK